MGVANTERWLQFNLAPAPLCLSIPVPHPTVAHVVESLGRAGLQARPSKWAPDAVVIDRGPLPTLDPALSRCWLQDEASHVVGLVPAPQPGMRTLDCCASPGGKTRQLAHAQQRQGLLVAGDLRPARMRLLWRMLLGGGVVPFAKVVCFDGTRPLPFSSAFDRILVDAPCTGVGTIRRDPEIKWTRQESDIQAHASRQLALLRRSADQVAIGGVITYATCSSEPEENDLVVDAFLADYSHFAQERVDITTGLSRALVDDRGALKTLPHVHDLESFFAVRLRRLR